MIAHDSTLQRRALEAELANIAFGRAAGVLAEFLGDAVIPGPPEPDAGFGAVGPEVWHEAPVGTDARTRFGVAVGPRGALEESGELTRVVGAMGWAVGRAVEECLRQFPQFGACFEAGPVDSIWRAQVQFREGDFPPVRFVLSLGRPPGT